MKNLLLRLFSFVFKVRTADLSDVVIYEADGSTRRLVTAKLEGLDLKKFVKNMHKRGDVKFVEVDGVAHYMKGTHVKSF